MRQKALLWSKGLTKYLTIYLLIYSRIKIAMADTEIQLLEQEKLIEQLKSMIRERDDAFQQKEKELQVSLGINS